MGEIEREDFRAMAYLEWSSVEWVAWGVCTFAPCRIYGIRGIVFLYT